MPNLNSYSTDGVNHWVVPTINHGNAPTGKTFGQSYYSQGRNVSLANVEINSENLKIADKKYIFEKQINFSWEINRNSFTETEYLRLSEQNKVQMHRLHAIFDDTRGFYQQFYSQKKLDDYDYFDSLQKNILNTTLTNINNDPLLAKQQQYFAARILNFYEDNYQETDGQLSDNVKLLFLKEAKVIDKNAVSIPAEINAKVKQYQKNAKYLDQIYNPDLNNPDIEFIVSESLTKILSKNKFSLEDLANLKDHINQTFSAFSEKTRNNIHDMLKSKLLQEDIKPDYEYDVPLLATQLTKIDYKDSNIENPIDLFMSKLNDILNIAQSTNILDLLSNTIKSSLKDESHPLRFLCEEKQFISGSTYTSDAKPYQTALRLIGQKKAEIQSFDTLSNPELYNDPVKSIDDKKDLFLDKLKTYLNDSNLNKTDLRHLHNFIYSTTENKDHPLRFICEKTGVVASALGQEYGETSTLNTAISMVKHHKSETSSSLASTPSSLFYPTHNSTKTSTASPSDQF
ncbi:MAG: hypothetical protein EP298_13415 [Gammaproteobacteria bacterium]|nr:MAG: hypothetical protein EP298_13415 [Gammaproteobacteria bacterium]UTW41723.1 hypothetical protein KFE69_09420 [bacterium SCSIO 12844]